MTILPDQLLKEFRKFIKLVHIYNQSSIVNICIYVYNINKLYSIIKFYLKFSYHRYYRSTDAFKYFSCTRKTRIMILLRNCAFRVIESSRCDIFVDPMKQHEDRKYTCRHSSFYYSIGLQLAWELVAQLWKETGKRTYISIFFEFIATTRVLCYDIKWIIIEYLEYPVWFILLYLLN